MIKLLIILKIGTAIPQSTRSVTVEGVTKYGVLPEANGNNIFYYEKYGSRSYIPCENVVFFGDYEWCSDLRKI